MKQIRESKFSKIVAYYLIIMMVLQITAPMQMYALTSGPTQPEFNSFTPIGTSDMVDLASGDFNYNIPIMDVGGYPINLAYNSGVTMDQEASWVGLGWNMNVGQIERQVRGLPDDFRGDKMTYENDLRKNETYGANFMVHPALFGTDFPLNIGMGLGVQYNNYEGITFKPSFGVTFELNDNVSIGANFSSSVSEGASVRPTVSAGPKMNDKSASGLKLSGSYGVSLNSRKGVENMSVSATLRNHDDKRRFVNSTSGSASLSFNPTSMTPTKRIGFKNKSFTFDGAFGFEIFGGEGQGQITGYGTTQEISSEYKYRQVNGYGYENTHYKMGNEGVMDFNREKEEEISVNTLMLPTTNYTYDIYTIQGQGIAGTFRPHRSQVSSVYNDYVSDFGDSESIGVEVGGGNTVHAGTNFNSTPTVSTTGRWISGNNALPLFSESSNEKKNRIDYEPYAYKLVGEMNVDSDHAYNAKLVQNRAVRFKLEGREFSRRTTRDFFDNTGVTSAISSKIKREKRLQRNQTVYKVNNKEATYDPFILKNNNAKPHHTAGYKVLQSGGSTYVYGETAYNVKKVEATFDVSGQTQSDKDKEDGLITYSSNPRTGTTLGNKNSDHYKNIIETPAYAHSYLITSVLSPDYEDIDQNGISDNDLGSYTKFSYKPAYQYKWRVPFNANTATYNEGLKSSKNDQKGNYLYGEKEVKYLHYIETKTHVAYFKTSPRQDARSSAGEDGGVGSARLQKLDEIVLYSKPELKAKGINISQGPSDTDNIVPIKTAHFVYNYELCQGADINGNGGKLTLERVYFTYKNSQMGKYTPYVFEYDNNKDYNLKGQDIWGNFKEKEGVLTNQEFPFVKQNLTTANDYATAWSLTKITLPSGGVITLETESDDYKYVQDKKAMQMFMVDGAGNSNDGSDSSPVLYEPYNHKNYIYVRISDVPLPADYDVYKKYLEGLPEEVYFRFMLNMTDTEEDYVSGYFSLDKLPNRTPIYNRFDRNGKTYLALKVKKVNMGGGIEAGRNVSPIVKAGWSFGRKFLNRMVYSMGGEETNKSFKAIIEDLVGSIEGFSQIYKGPNKVLEEDNRCKRFDPSKSWVRLNCPENKLGGGLRVKSIKLSDNWDVMNGSADNYYDQKYGQEYDYNYEDGITSGVATFEPNGCPENPLVVPIYNKSKGFDSAISVKNYLDAPLGEGFFPSPTVTYARVTVSQLKNGENITKHGSGKTVTHHYTSRDFPTIVRYTDLEFYNDENKSSPMSLLNVYSRNQITASQGFAFETNDMNGKVKMEEVYAEKQNIPISKVEYKYNLDTNGKLTNKFTTIDSEGKIDPNTTLGVTTDLITDFNESNSQSATDGVDTNIATFLLAIIPIVIPIPLPKHSEHSNILRTATTTKVTHRTGVLVEKIAYDLGSRVSTKNLAWDAESGDVILTETINEFNDKYYSFNYPAYWMYQSMGLAANNIGIEGYLQRINECGSDYDPSPYFKVKKYASDSVLTNIINIFQVGDELVLQDADNATVPPKKVWVVGISPSGNGLVLMDKDGSYIDNCGNNYTGYRFKIVRSGYRNLQNANMASVTCMLNPLLINSNLPNTDLSNFKDKLDEDLFKFSGTGYNPRIVNASAVVYTDEWQPQNEEIYNLYFGNYYGEGSAVERVSYPNITGFNPYINNILGEWRAQRSYAYLTGRNASRNGVNNPRHEGFFTKYNSFYQLKNGSWVVNNIGWQFASSITQFSPFGNEIENKDALERFSSAQFGYSHKLPMAVASNSKYNEMGFEGFEETQSNSNKHFGFRTGTATPVITSNEHSHTGNKSVKVANNSHVNINRLIKPGRLIERPQTCSYDCSKVLNISGTNHRMGRGSCYYLENANPKTGCYLIENPYKKYSVSIDNCLQDSKLSFTSTNQGYCKLTQVNDREILVEIEPTLLNGPQNQYVSIYLNGNLVRLTYDLPAFKAAGQCVYDPDTGEVYGTASGACDVKGSFNLRCQ